MNVTIDNTSNNTVIISYQTENPQREIENEIWREREKFLNNNSEKIMERMMVDLNCNKEDSFLENYDKETHHIQHKTDYITQWKLKSLINELKALTPLYQDYTIISVKYRGMYYAMDYSAPVWLSSSTDDTIFDDISYLIAESFTELIKLLKRLLELKPFCIYNFTCELLPNNLKRKNKRKRTHIPRGMRHEVFKRDNYTCVECGATKSNGATLHVDHIIPVSKNGTDELDNLQTLCSDCNLNKSNIIQSR